MSGDYGNDFIVLTDEEGNETEFEHIDTMEHNGATYVALLPASDDPSAVLDEANPLCVLKIETEDGEDILTTIEDDEELEAVFEGFVARLGDYYEIEE